MRKIARIDANHTEIVQTLRMLGCSVVSLAPLGDGIPDLLCGYRGITFLCEIKDGSKPPSARMLTPDEREFFQSWRGGLLTVLNSSDEAIAFVKKLTIN